ncbi:hypothetical protein AOLI_G00110450 [Acnodon oligacanthus]
MKALEATQAHECAASMESVSGASKRRRHCLRTAANGAPLVLSAVSVAFCVLLGVQTNDVRNRMTDWESARLSYPLAALSTEQLNSVIRERVDELLAQRTYEQFSRIRTARQASPECNCPPGRFLTLISYKARRYSCAAKQTVTGDFGGCVENLVLWRSRLDGVTAACEATQHECVLASRTVRQPEAPCSLRSACFCEHSELRWGSVLQSRLLDVIRDAVLAASCAVSDPDWHLA